MELEDSGHHPFSKLSRVANGSREEGGGGRIEGNGGRHGGGGGDANGGEGCRGGILPWQQDPASRIYRVSRASGGKDRHSKVYTARGLRDRRVRLSVSTAIQFYDLQDRLGYDQPSKAIEWLIKAAAAAIDELPSLDGFLNLPNPGKEDKKTTEADSSYNHQHQHLSTKSGCSSTSETSKGSVLSLSRPSESRVMAGDRAPERATKEDGDDVKVSHQQVLTPSLHPQTSFTELLTCGGCASGNGATGITGDGSNRNCTQRKIFTADYFGQAGLFPRSQPHIGSNSALSVMPLDIAASNTTTTTNAAAAASHLEMPQLAFLQDHLMPVPAMAPPPGDYNLSFPFSSCIAGLNRGTLQSNSQSQLPHHLHSYSHIQRLPSPVVDGSNMPFFFGATVASAAAATSVENHYPTGFDGCLKLFYADGSQHSDLKGKGKS